MYEFCMGVILGYMGVMILRGTKKKTSVATQADELVIALQTSEPILIQNSKSKFSPKLTNFWGPDS